MARIVSKVPVHGPIENQKKDYLNHPPHEERYHDDVVVDSRFEDLAHLITHVEGYQWKVNYFSQVISRDTGIRGLNPTADDVHQQYKLIEGLIIKVESPLSWVQDDKTKFATSNGVGYITPPIVPNEGDMFIADAGDGYSILFTITRSEQLSMYKQAVYRIDYTAVDYAYGEILQSLERKVVEHLFYEPEFMDYGQNPLLIKSEKVLVERIKEFMPLIKEHYFRKYYSARFNTMILPYDDFYIYDHFLAKCIQRWFSSRDHPELVKFKLYAVEHIRGLKDLESIFDLIEHQTLFNFPTLFNKVGLLSSSQAKVNPRIDQIYYSGIDKIIYPMNGDYILKLRDRTNSLYGPLPTTAGLSTGDNYQEVFMGKDLLPNIDLSESYIFSESFYKEEFSDCSQMELLVYRYLDRNLLEVPVLDRLIETWHSWGSLQQFYLTPILICLMKAKMRGL